LVGLNNKLYKMHGIYINIAELFHFIDGLFNDTVDILENIASKMALQ